MLIHTSLKYYQNGPRRNPLFQLSWITCLSGNVKDNGMCYKLFDVNIVITLYLILLCLYENMTLKITLKVQPQWNTPETTLKIFTKDNHTVIFCKIILKTGRHCYLIKLKIFSVTHISFVLSIFSATLVFQCYFQCHNLMIIIVH